MNIIYLSLFQIAYMMTVTETTEICSSKQYCDTKDVKFRSFTQFGNSYFNSTHVIKRQPITNQSRCIAACVSTSNCQSTNHYLENSKNQMMCDLINEAKWTNMTFYVHRPQSAHYSIKTACASNPCKNGGTCVPIFHDETYKCSCPQNTHVKFISGHHCEIVKAAEETAKIYYSFDSNTPIKDLKSIAAHSISSTGNAKVLMLPDRPSPVIYIPGETGSEFISTSYGVDCFTRIGLCGNEGLSVSFWFKFVQSYKDKFPVACETKMTHAAQSRPTENDHGFIVEMNACDKDAFIVKLRSYDKTYTVQWGSAHNTSLHRTWSHIMFTYRNQYGVIMYFNGNEVARNLSPLIVGGRYAKAGILRFGGHGKGLQMYLDDFAAWYHFLNAEHVHYLYTEGLKRNMPVRNKI